MKTYKCLYCQKIFIGRTRSHKYKYCSTKCYGLAHRNINHRGWKQGRTTPSDRNQPIYVSVIGHPRAKGRNHRVKEHIIIAEKALGKYLPPKAVIHHVDTNRQNNTPNNLVICENQGYHMTLHARLDRLRDTGDINTKRCGLCGTIKQLEEFSKKKGSFDGRLNICRKCRKTTRHDRRI